MTPISIRREAVARACLKRFEGRQMQFGSADCVRLAAHAMHKLNVPVPLLKGVRYRSELGAAKALNAAGFADLAEAMDAMGFARIAPAMAWPGDIVAGRSRDDGPFRYALSVVHEYGAKRTIAFGPNGFCGVGTPDLTNPDDVFAWRVSHG